MLRLAVPLLALALSAPSAFAAGACEACRAEDEQQIGNYVEPDVTIPRSPKLPDPRGEEVAIPLPGGPRTVRVNPRDGLWLGAPGEGKGNIFLNGQRDKASVGWRLGF